MSGGRFLVSLKEIYRSESIVKLKTFLNKNVELTTITHPVTDEESVTLHSFIQEIINEYLSHITICQYAVEVITFFQGIYLAHYSRQSIVKNAK